MNNKSVITILKYDSSKIHLVVVPFLKVFSTYSKNIFTKACKDSYVVVCLFRIRKST